MLYAVVVNLNSSISHQSRNACCTWKKPRKLINVNLSSKVRTISCVSPRQSCSLCANFLCKKNSPASLSQQLLLLSAKRIYISARRKYTHCMHTVFNVQKRYGSQKHQWKKSLREVISSVHAKLLPIRFSFAGNYIKPRFKYPSSVSIKSIWDIDMFTNYVSSGIKLKSTDTSISEKKTPVSKVDNENITSDETKSISTEEEVLSKKLDVPSTNENDKSKIDNNNVIQNSECVDVHDKSNVDAVVENLDEKLPKTLVKRSQYEHLVTSLASQQEADKISYETSVFESVKSFMEIPVNTFISLVSRANVFDKTSTSNSDDNSSSLSVAKSKEEVNNSGKKIASKRPPPPPTLLETLYQYIPYVSSPAESPKKGTNVPKKTKGFEYKDESRLKAEKELLLEKVSINNRTRYLIQEIQRSNSLIALSRHVEELCDHILRFPDTRITAVKENAIKEIMHIYRTTYDKDLLPTLRMTLAMLGAVDPPKQRGIRVLSIDGGGSRGIASVEIFRKLTELSGRPINEMFDYICGVSTGAILAFFLGIKKLSVEEIGPLYRAMSSEIFNQNRLVGAGNLVFSHAYYDTENYQRVLKNIFGNQLLIETAAHEDIPKCSAVSTLVNRLPLKPFIWRNYSIVPGTRQTHWSGSCRSTMWEAIRASSAAPGYFEEFKKGYNIHQDGGVLTNNPTGVALNECRLLWPNAPIQCVVSVGTGRYEPTVGPVGEEFSSLKDKLWKFVDSATSVTEVHTVMHNLLPSGTYFRFNPFIDEPLMLDECRAEKLDLLVENTCNYIERNEYKFKRCVSTLIGQKVPDKSTATDIQLLDS